MLRKLKAALVVFILIVIIRDTVYFIRGPSKPSTDSAPLVAKGLHTKVYYLGREQDSGLRKLMTTLTDKFFQDVSAFEAQQAEHEAIRYYTTTLLIRDGIDPVKNETGVTNAIITQFTPWAKTIVFTGYDSYEDATRFLAGSKGRVKYLPKMAQHGDGDSVEKLLESLPWLLQEGDRDALDDATDDTGLQGQILQAVSIPWEDVCRHITNHPSHLHQMPPRKFEMLIAEIFKDHGWAVELTSQTRDGGYDLIALQYAHPLNLRVLVEAKRWSPERPVGVSVVRGLYGLRALESFSQVVLATSSYVSGPAKKAFERQIPWELDFLERDKILEWCRSYRAIQISGDFPT